MDNRDGASCVVRAEQGTIRFCTSPDQWQESNVASVWESRLEESNSIQELFQSPTWFQHMAAIRTRGDVVLATLDDASSGLQAVVPLRTGEATLDFKVCHTTLWACKLRAVYVLGGQPLLPKVASLYDSFFSAVIQRFPSQHCVRLPLIPCDDFFWEYLHKSEHLKEQFTLYIPEISGAGDVHAIEFPRTLAEYWSHFTSKQRKNIKRDAKLLQTHCNNKLELKRFNTRRQLPDFMRAALEISRVSWQEKGGDGHFRDGVDWDKTLSDLADRGVLRSYVLYGDGVPLAFTVGYEYRNRYYYMMTGYDRRLCRLAPGISLLTMIIEDLYRTGSPRSLSFGFGDNRFKREFGNRHRPHAHVVLVRNSIANHLRVSSHAAFRAAVCTVRDMVRKYAPLKRPMVTESQKTLREAS